MVHYRGRYQRRPMTARAIFRRRIRRRRPIRRRKQRNQYIKASRITNRNKRQLRKLRWGAIPRPLNRPNHRLYRTSNTTQFVLAANTINTANGVYQYDFVLGDTMMSMDLTFILNMYYYVQLVGFTYQIVISDTSNLSELWNSGNTNNYVTTQNTLLGKNEPDMAFINNNDNATQALFFALNNSSAPAGSNRSKWFSNPKVQRLTQNTKVHGTFHLPTSYRGTYDNTGGGTLGTAITQWCTAPTSNQPHGFTICWFDVAQYSGLGAACTVTCQINCNAVWAMKDIIPGI